MRKNYPKSRVCNLDSELCKKMQIVQLPHPGGGPLVLKQWSQLIKKIVENAIKLSPNSCLLDKSPSPQRALAGVSIRCGHPKGCPLQNGQPTPCSASFGLAFRKGQKSKFSANATGLVFKSSPGHTGMLPH